MLGAPLLLLDECPARRNEMSQWVYDNEFHCELSIAHVHTLSRSATDEWNVKSA
jgi:hypothetical protein